MTVSFFGHRNIYEDLDVIGKISEILENNFANSNVTFYVGANGKFDYLSIESCVRYRRVHSNVRICFVTAYLHEDYLKNRKDIVDCCDEVIYPDVENVPKRLAIAERNKRVVDMSDVVICYLERTWGERSRR